ncbi:MAG: SufD family Fe-S cluster assembly protein [Flavobacteriales bacterium]|nr:SufD family Fe-S cluster assembly protein [Flavobacteriales bacterium]
MAKLFNQPYAAPNGDATVTLPARLPFDATRVVFVNGHFRADLSDDLKVDKGIVIDSLKHHLVHGPVKAHYGQVAPIGDRLFTAMNAAAPTDGLIILATKGTKTSRPLHVLHITTDGGQLIQPRDLFMLHEGANVEVIIEHIATDCASSLVNSIRESVIGEGANLTIHLLQNEANGPAHIGLDGVTIGAKGRFSIDTTTLNGSLVRNEVNVALAGPGSACRTERCVCAERHHALRQPHLHRSRRSGLHQRRALQGHRGGERHGRVQRQGVREAGCPAHPRLPEQREHPARR